MRTRMAPVVGLLTLLAAACGGGGEAAEQTEPRGTAQAPGAPAPLDSPDAVGAPVEQAPVPLEASGEPSAGTPDASRPAPPAGGVATPAPGGTPPSDAAGRPVERAPVETPGDALSVLRRAERVQEDMRSLQADFVQDLTIPLLNSTQRSRGTLSVRRPDRFLMRFSDPEGDVVVADGRHLWMYYPSNDPRQVIRTTLARGGGQIDLHREFLSNAEQRFSATLDGQETVAGRASDVLTLTPRGASPYRRIRIWVDRQDGQVRQFEILEENDSLRRLTLQNLRVNPSLGDQLFAFTPPPGAQVFDQ